LRHRVAELGRAYKGDRSTNREREGGGVAVDEELTSETIKLVTICGVDKPFGADR